MLSRAQAMSAKLILRAEIRKKPLPVVALQAIKTGLWRYYGQKHAPVRGCFAALQRHPAPVRGENAEMKQQILTMKKYKNIHIGAIATFYIISLLLRLISLYVVNKFPSIETNNALQILAALATGLGPAIGALVAMFVFKRKTEYTLIGKSVWKSIATIVVPCIVFGIIGGWNMGVICFWAFAYGLLEEYGWRGFLQYELRNLPVWQYVLIITVMWFLWHLDLNLRSVLPFFLLLLFASWGIGKVVSDTHSLLLCAAFHGIVNFSKHGLLDDTTCLIAFICIIIFWIVIWYFVKLPRSKSSET